MTGPVGIVGAGPAGLVLAHLLRREGIPFVLVERHPHAELRGRAKAGLVEYRTVRLLEAEGIAGPILRFDVENHRCEFRTPDEAVVLDYARLTGGRPHYIFPQHQLVGELCDDLVAGGADIRFGTTVTGVRESGADVVLLLEGPAGPSQLACGVVAGCDGVRSVVAAALSGARVLEERIPVRWLGVIGQAPPLEPHTIYAAHPRGFAGQMRRGPELTRYFLEVAGGDGEAEWPERRIRDELSLRLGVPGRLEDVPLGDMTFVELRVRMTAPMQQGRVFLAGDSAHLITPAGGKGMNLAIQDAVELGHGLIEVFGEARDERRLARYSETRMPAIWRTQAFSNWMLRLILASLHARRPGRRRRRIRTQPARGLGGLAPPRSAARDVVRARLRRGRRAGGGRSLDD